MVLKIYCYYCYYFVLYLKKYYIITDIFSLLHSVQTESRAPTDFYSMDIWDDTRESNSKLHHYGAMKWDVDTNLSSFTLHWR